MIRVAVVGLGKMGLSHFSMINAHPDVEVVAMCDPVGYMLDVLEKYSGVKGYTDYKKMLAEATLDAVVIATPSRLHATFVEQALERGLHVFCEKPFCLSLDDSERLTALAKTKMLVNQVGYHYRFVGAFQEMKRLLDAKAIGEVTHVLAEAYGPVVLKPKGATWRSQSAEGGGCLYDYAAHPLNLLTWCFGQPADVVGSVLRKVFSRDTDDEVYSTLLFDGGLTGQLSVSWSDDSFRKMSTKITVMGTNGRIVADRQECQVYLRDASAAPEPYGEGWTVRYVTDMQEPVWFYIRGEEYSAQLAYFVEKIKNKDMDNVNSFAEAALTDTVITMIKADAAGEGRPSRAATPAKPRKAKPTGFLGFFDKTSNV